MAVASCSGAPTRGLAEQGFDGGIAFAQRLVERLRIFAAGFGHVGTASAGAADLLRDLANDLAGLKFCGEVFGDADDDGNLAVGDRADDDHAGADLVAEVIDQGAELRAVEVIGAVGQNLDALHFLHVLIGAGHGRGGRLHANLVEFLAEFLELVFAAVELLPESFGGAEVAAPYQG